MGLDTIGSFDHMSRATATGIATVFHPILAARADDITGATMSATTAGRIPMNMLDRVSFSFMRSGVRKMAMHSIIMNDGNMVPSAAIVAPFMPLSLSPTATDIFTARIPGNDWATASRSRNSSRSIQCFLSTISFSMIEIIAQPPPNVKAPILKNDRNN